MSPVRAVTFTKYNFYFFLGHPIHFIHRECMGNDSHGRNVGFINAKGTVQCTNRHL